MGFKTLTCPTTIYQCLDKLDCKMENVVEFLKRFRELDGKSRVVVKNDPETSSLLSMTLDEFGKQNLAILVRSYLLGEHIYLIPNQNMSPQSSGGLVTYLPEELIAISRLSPTGLKNIHRIKKIFDGEIVSWSSQ